MDDSARRLRDAKIVERIRGDDPSALGDLVRAYAEWLVEVANDVVRAPDIAQDVVQEVFAWVWDTRAKLAIQGSVPAYLYRAVTNRAYNMASRERTQRNIEARTHELHEGMEPRVGHEGDAGLTNAEFRSALDAALQQLQPRTKDVFLMRAEQDMSYEEIAEALGITVSTAYKQVYKATKELAELLKPWLEGNN